jgi:hypothetical protein
VLVLDFSNSILMEIPYTMIGRCTAKKITVLLSRHFVQKTNKYTIKSKKKYILSGKTRPHTAYHENSIDHYTNFFKWKSMEKQMQDGHFIDGEIQKAI